MGMLVAMSERHYLAGLDLTDRRVVVVGGGTVAQRRLPKLVSAGARVEVIAPEVTTAVQGMAEIVECHLMVGDCDALLRIVVADLNSYWRFQADRLTRIANVQNVKTDVPMETVKHSYELPL